MSGIATLNYVARKTPCGCVVGICAMDLDAKEVGDFLVEQVGYGNTVEIQNDDWIRNGDWKLGCKCK